MAEGRRARWCWKATRPATGARRKDPLESSPAAENWRIHSTAPDRVPTASRSSDCVRQWPCRMPALSPEPDRLHQRPWHRNAPEERPKNGIFWASRRLFGEQRTSQVPVFHQTSRWSGHTLSAAGRGRSGCSSAADALSTKRISAYHQIMIFRTGDTLRRGFPNTARDGPRHRR